MDSSKPYYNERVISEKEQRIRKITHFYYSNPEVQKAIFDFTSAISLNNKDELAIAMMVKSANFIFDFMYLSFSIFQLSSSIIIKYLLVQLLLSRIHSASSRWI